MQRYLFLNCGSSPFIQLSLPPSHCIFFSLIFWLTQSQVSIFLTGPCLTNCLFRFTSGLFYYISLFCWDRWNKSASYHDWSDTALLSQTAHYRMCINHSDTFIQCSLTAITVLPGTHGHWSTILACCCWVTGLVVSFDTHEAWETEPLVLVCYAVERQRAWWGVYVCLCCLGSKQQHLFVAIF